MGDVVIEAVDAAEAGLDFWSRANLGGVAWIVVMPGKALHYMSPAVPLSLGMTSLCCCKKGTVLGTVPFLHVD